MYMIEVVTRIINRPNETYAIVCTNVMSITHLGIIKFIFEVMQMGPFKNRDMSMYVFVDDHMLRIATKVVVTNDNMTVCVSCGWLATR